MSKDISVLSLDIYNEFKCIGGACEQTCCKEWTIDFTKEEYGSVVERHSDRNCKNYFIDREINGTVKKCIIFNKDGECPFLDENRLCSIQKECGFELLSKTCRAFPRVTILYDTVFECYLSTGCEKVIQMLLEKRDGLAIEQRELKISEVSDYGDKVFKIVSESDIQKRYIYSFWYDIKVLGLSILMDRSYSIEERMLLLGIALKRIDDFEKASNYIEIKPYIEFFLENISDGKLKNELAAFAGNEDLKTKAAISQTLIMYYRGEYENEIISEIRERLGIKRLETEFEENGLRFHTDPYYKKEVYEECLKHYKDFMYDKEYFLENYMVANFLSGYIPFSDDGKSLLDSYKMFVSIFLVFKFCITVYMDENKTTEDLIYLSVDFSRNFVHSYHLIDRLNAIIKAANMETIAHMAIMLL